MKLLKKDLRITFFKSSGPGGQHKNKTETAVRIKHLPTGIMATASSSRSQTINRKTALECLEQKLHAHFTEKKKRLPTKISKNRNEVRLKSKKMLSQKKKIRTCKDLLSF